jgi:phosphoribosylanthranilate isomerase
MNALARPLVKICGLTRLPDAVWAWRCGADLLGFIQVPSSPRYIAPGRLAALVAALRHAGCRSTLVGVFAGESLDIVRAVMAQCQLDVAQLHGDESPEYARALELPVIVARRVRDRVPWRELAAYDAYAYLLDSFNPQQLGGSGRHWDWRLADGATLRDQRVLIAGGLSPLNVAAAVAQLDPWGVDVSSGVESAPGRKDSAQVREFTQAVKLAQVDTMDGNELG